MRVGLIALLPAVAWGSADFLAGTRPTAGSPTEVAARSQLVSAAFVFAVLLPIFGFPAARWDAVPPVLGGVAGTLGLVALYHALRAAPIAVVAPLAACGVALPVIRGALAGDRLSGIAVTGIAIGLAGILCLSVGSVDAHDSGGEVTLRALGLAALGAIGYGGFLVGVTWSRGVDAVDATILARAGALLVALAVLCKFSSRPVGQAPARRRPPPAIVAIGVLDAVGVLSFTAATTRQSLAITAVLASLYPAVTVGLAYRFAGELLTTRQRLGIVLTLLAIGLLAVG